MKVANTKEFQSLLVNIQKCLKKYSVIELNNALVSFFSKKLDNSSEIDFVLMEICKEYCISKRTLTHSTARGTTQQARKIAYCIFNLNLGLPGRYISNKIMFGTTHHTVSRAIREYKALSNSVKTDREFKEKYEKIQQKLAEYLVNQ